VGSLIYVRPADPSNRADAELATRLVKALSRYQRPGWQDIYATIRDGVVSLSGTVSSSRDEQLAISVVQHTAGVQHVKHEVQIVESRSRKPAAEKASDPLPAPPKRKESRENQFKHLPVISESLKDQLTGRVKS
jgi:hypothetical protein